MKIGIFFLTSITVLLLISTTILLQNNMQLTNTNMQLTNDHRKMEISISNLENQMVNQEILNAEYRESNEILINELELQIKEYGNLQTILSQLNTDLNNLNSDLNDINHQKINLESEIQQQKNIRIQLELEIQINQEKVSNLNNVRETQLAKIISLESTIFELNELTVELDDLTQYSNDLESQISLLNNEKTTQLTKIVSLESTIFKLNNEIIFLEESNDELQEKYNDVIKGTFLENLEEISQLGESLKDSVVNIESGSARGTGFFISNNGCIITNAHVTNGRDTFTIELVDGTRLEGQLLKEGNYERNRFFIGEYDIALIKINYYDATPIIISDTAPLPNEIVVTVGHPGRLGNWVIAAGHFNGDWEDDFSFELPAFPGSSGSPIVNMDMELVGLLWGGSTWNPINQNHDDVVWKGNLGEFLTVNHYTLAESLFSVRDFLSDTECSVG